MPEDSLIGRQLNNFKIESLIGQGGMAQVYYGHDVKLNRPVAIKVIDARFRNNPTYAERFVREAQAVSTWRHENIVQIYYADDEDGLYYFVMEHIDGEDLGQRMVHAADRGELLPQSEVLRVCRAIASALDYAHKKGVIHRDVKPANALIAQDDRVVLSDFGLALDVEQGSLGEVFGTSHYVAPEQARRSADAVPQSDLYSLGVILYQMLTGVVPFDDPSPTAVALQHITQPPPLPRESNPDLSLETESLLLKALSKDPANRYQTGLALMDALESVLQGASPAPPPPSPPPDAAKKDSLIGRQLGEYRLEKLLGKGGMAAVYQGRDARLDRRAAIKVIDTPYRRDPEYIKRFEREAKAVAQLEHPHIVSLYRYGEAGGLLYIAMQYVEGRDLYELLNDYAVRQEQMPPAEISRITRQICGALDYAHQKGVIHRDVKPSNIMLDGEGHAYLTDFGLVLLTDLGTRGEILGSPHYLSPEQAVSSAGAVPQSDLYAVGVILYQIFTGSLPFEAEDPLEVALLQMSEAPRPPRELHPEISESLEALILKALAKEPEKRYPTGAALADALDAALSGEESPAVTAEDFALLPLPVAVPPVEAAADKAAAPPPPPPRQPIPREADALPLPPVPLAVSADKGAAAGSPPPSITSIIADELPKKPASPAPAPAPVKVKSANRRPLYIGAALVLLIIAALLFFVFRAGNEEKSVEATRIALGGAVDAAATQEPEPTPSTVAQSISPLASPTPTRALVKTEATDSADSVAVIASQEDETTPSAVKETFTTSESGEDTMATVSATPSSTPQPTASSTSVSAPVEISATLTSTPTATPAPVEISATLTSTPTATPAPVETSATLTATLTATPTPIPYHLAFTKWDGGKHSIWTVKLDGSEKTWLSDYAASPSWTSDGERIVFFGETGISNQRKVPNGSEGIWRMTADGVYFRQLLEDGNARAIALSPGDGLIAFDSRRGSDYVIYFADGEGRETSTQIPGEIPSWSPDGGWLAAKACRPDCGLWLVRRNGSGAAQLTFNGGDGLPAWAPDNKKIAFSRPSGGALDIFTVNVNGTGLTQLTDAPGNDSLPVWTPDSRQIVFRSTRGGFWQIYVMNADGSDQRPVIPDDVGGSDEWAFDRMSVR